MENVFFFYIRFIVSDEDDVKIVLKSSLNDRENSVHYMELISLSLDNAEIYLFLTLLTGLKYLYAPCATHVGVR